MFSSVVSSGRPRNSSASEVVKGLEHRRDRDLVVAHAQARRHVARIDPGDVGRVGRRHHHRTHPISAQGVDRDRQHQRGVDAARQADDHARKAVLADVVAHAGDQRAPGLLLQARDVVTLAARRAAFVDLDPHQARLEAAAANNDAAVSIGGERRTVEDDLVLPAHQMGIEQRHAHSLCTLGHPRLALTRLVEMERRRIEHAQHLRAGGHRSRSRLVEPGVLADQYTEPLATGVEHHRWQPRLATADEVAALIEHLIVRQLALAIGRLHAPADQQRGRVEAHRCGQRLGALCRHRAAARRMTKQHRQALQRRQFGRPTHRAAARRHP